MFIYLKVINFHLLSSCTVLMEAGLITNPYSGCSIFSISLSQSNIQVTYHILNSKASYTACIHRGCLLGASSCPLNSTRAPFSIHTIFYTETVAPQFFNICTIDITSYINNLLMIIITNSIMLC